jgi:hypothetical protein
MSGCSWPSENPLEIKDEGVSVDADVTTIDFTGAGVVASQTAPGVVDVAIPGGGGGEANTASNVGTGAGGVYKQKVGVDLELKTIKAGSGIAVTNNVSDITIDNTQTPGESNTGSNLGAGAEVFKQKTGVDLEHRTLTEGANITLTESATEIEIAASGGSGGVNQILIPCDDWWKPDQSTPQGFNAVFQYFAGNDIAYRRGYSFGTAGTDERMTIFPIPINYNAGNGFDLWLYTMPTNNESNAAYNTVRWRVYTRALASGDTMDFGRGSMQDTGQFTTIVTAPTSAQYTLHYGVKNAIMPNNSPSSGKLCVLILKRDSQTPGGVEFAKNLNWLYGAIRWTP